ncbi:hypothetical protein, partial [Escherichia sp. MOD1-EC6097]
MRSLRLHQVKSFATGRIVARQLRGVLAEFSKCGFHTGNLLRDGVHCGEQLFALPGGQREGFVVLVVLFCVVLSLIAGAAFRLVITGIFRGILRAELRDVFFQFFQAFIDRNLKPGKIEKTPESESPGDISRV